MITSAALILFFALVFCGIGLLFPGAESRHSFSLDSLFRSFWTGWALVISVLQITHLFFPVGLPALIAALLAGALGWGLARREILAYGSRLRFWPSLGLAVLAAIPALVLSNHVMFVPAHIDHGLYHMQTVKWIESYAIIPGLGNLHHRLAFNNANFLTAALLNAGPLAGRSYYLSNTLLAWVLIVQCAAGFWSLLHSNTPRLSAVYYAWMTPAVIWQMSTTHLPGYSPDIPVFALQVVLAGEVLRLFEQRGTENRAAFARQALYLTLLAATGIAVKLSFVVFGALVLLITLGLWIAENGLDLKRQARPYLTALAVLALWLVPWLGRGALLSGYLLFPSTAFPLPVPWRIPEHLADPIAPIITEWARTASNQIPFTANLDWFQRWLRIFTYEARMAFIYTIFILLLNLGLWLAARAAAKKDPTKYQEQRFDLPSALIFGLSAAGLVYWFIMAPDYRFSGACFWILLVAALLWGYQLLARSAWVQSPSKLAIGVLFILALGLAPNQFSKNISPSLLLNPLLEPQVAEQNSPASAAQVRQTASGLTVYLPRDNRTGCWNLPLPCTPVLDFTQKLRLIDPNNVQRGFMIQMPPATRDQP